MRLEGKIAVIIGAGQGPGEGIGNGRATAIRFAQEGARILAVDRDIELAKETAVLATKEGGECVPFEADVTKERTLAAAIMAAHQRWARVDILHNNVGVSIAGGDASLLEITEDAFDRICAINLRGTVMACKHVLPIMRQQQSGVIINISSIAAWEEYPFVTYKATKAALIAFTQQVAIQNAEFGIRASADLKSIMDELTFASPAPRTAAPTAAQITAARREAHNAGHPAAALAYALQFEGQVRQYDVIGEWLPLDDPRPSALIDSNKKWIGPTWAHVDSNMILRFTPTKTEDTSAAKITLDLRSYPMVMEELVRSPKMPAKAR